MFENPGFSKIVKIKIFSDIIKISDKFNAFPGLKFFCNTGCSHFYLYNNLNNISNYISCCLKFNMYYISNQHCDFNKTYIISLICHSLKQKPDWVTKN